eukprot:TRINITY_DN32149_c0_g1_i6.p1 TRINITY_DN32149_c0_g1~~TRINITY_DN32149_c0_g1_i6.p1  ORF type:complete len:409 (-),score=111.24 TRINITY_DN32149_c0_g1_i6:219-1445(-)
MKKPAAAAAAGNGGVRKSSKSEGGSGLRKANASVPPKETRAEAAGGSPGKASATGQRAVSRGPKPCSPPSPNGSGKGGERSLMKSLSSVFGFGSGGSAPLRTSLEQQDGSYLWLRRANDTHSRSLREAAARETATAAQQGWYQLDKVKVPLSAAATAEQGTVMLSSSLQGGVWPKLPDDRPFARTLCKHIGGTTTVLDAAVALSGAGAAVAAFSAASRYHVGGGFSTGGRHALEEAICMQTTLYRCLKKAQQEAKKYDGEAYIPEDGAILSPRVEVFRSGTDHGYAWMEKPTELGSVVSVAMPNLNREVRDAPADHFDNLAKYTAALRARWSAGVTDIVCPDAGCGVYGNDPTAVGVALKQALKEYSGHFQVLWLVGSEDFAAAAGAAQVLELRAAQKEVSGRCPKSV